MDRALAVPTTPNLIPTANPDDGAATTQNVDLVCPKTSFWGTMMLMFLAYKDTQHEE